MENILTDYIKSELLILVPVLWLIGQGIKKTSVKNSFIPLILGGCGIFLACLYVFSVTDFYCFKCVLQAFFAGITQGLLCAGASVYCNELLKTFSEKTSDK